jgi:hypothetical protein
MRADWPKSMPQPPLLMPPFLRNIKGACFHDIDNGIPAMSVSFGKILRNEIEHHQTKVHGRLAATTEGK